MIDSMRELLILVEVALLLAPFFYLYRKNKVIDPFHPLVLFSAGYSLFYLFPNIYYLTKDNQVFVENPWLAIQALGWAIVGIVSFYVGFLTFNLIRVKRPVSKPRIVNRRISYFIVLFEIISVVTLLLFINSVGGLHYYLTNLNNTIELTAGKMYLIWGILLSRSAFLLGLIYYFKISTRNRLHKILLLASFVFAFMMVSVIGARLLIISFIIELLIIIHYCLKRISLRSLVIMGFALVVVFVLGFGAWRNYGWESERKDMSFVQYLAYDLKNNLGDRLFNNYFDSTRNFAYTLKYTDNGIPIQWGRTYYALFVQPLPRAIRPGVRLPYGEEMNGIHCSSPNGGIYCGIDPLLAELYQNFLGFGIVGGLLFMGMGFAYLYNSLVENNTQKDVFTYVVYAIFGYGLLLWLRGTFIGHTSLILMDLVPLLIVRRLVTIKQ